MSVAPVPPAERDAGRADASSRPRNATVKPGNGSPDSRPLTLRIQVGADVEALIDVCAAASPAA